jgi:hypothetical protein
MLIRFTVKRKDTGAGVPGARIEIEKAETVGFTDNNGYAEIVTYWSGNWIYSVTVPGYEKITGTLNNRDIPILNFGVSVLYNAISQPPQPGTKEEIIDRIGSSCSIINNYNFGKSFYQVRHDRKGNLSSLSLDLPSTKDLARRTAACFEIPPPPPKTADEVGAEVTSLQKMLNDTVGKIENIGQGISDLAGSLAKQGQDLTAAINGIWDKMEAWLIERIIGIILKALDNEVARIK